MTLDPETRFKIEDVLVHDEGLRLEPYRDLKGNWTIGVGRLIGASLENLELSYDTVMQMLTEDVERHWAEAVTLFGNEFLSDLEPARKAAIVSLLFTLGRVKFSKFAQTLPALQQRRWNDAASLLLNTKWAKDVDPLSRPGVGRDDRVAHMLRTGEFPADYKLV